MVTNIKGDIHDPPPEALTPNNLALIHDPRRFFQIVIEHARGTEGQAALGAKLLNEALMASTRVYRLSRWIPFLVAVGAMFVIASAGLFVSLLILRAVAPPWIEAGANIAIALAIGLFGVYHLLSSEISRVQGRALAFYNEAIRNLHEGSEPPPKD